MDTRLAALTRWLDNPLGGPLAGRAFTLAPASADASFRRYFRATLADGGSFVAMDAPPEREDLQPFLRVARLLAEAGVHAPRIHAQDPAQGFLLLEDLGPRSYLDALNEDNAGALMQDAIDALVKWQLATRAGELPPYDEALLRRELALFPEWYVQRHLGRAFDAAQGAAWEGLCATLVASALAQPAVYVHRDYMPRNLMLSEPNPGVLDFQDAVLGPITYDIASLTRDAFVSWDEQRVLDWAARYWQGAQRARLPVPADFAEYWRALEWMGLQRHLKVLGIFARLAHRDGKARYVADAPRFLGYARAAARRYRALAPLARLLDELHR